MYLNLHPNAELAFNRDAEALLQQLTPLERSTVVRTDRNFELGVIPGFDAISSEPEDGYLMVRDPLGVTLARFFRHSGIDIGLGQDAYRKLVKLTEAIYLTSNFSDIISSLTLEERIFLWVVARYKGETDSSMSNFVIPKCEAEFREFTVWLPVAALYIESDVSIGRVILRSFMPEFFDRFTLQSLPSNQSDEHIEWLRSLRQRYQGRAGVTITRFGDQRRIIEIANEEGYQALAMLRLFSPAALYPGLVSYCDLDGQENNEQYTRFCVAADQHVVSAGIVDKSFAPWTLDAEQIRLINAAGLSTLGDLLNLAKPSPFQKAVLESLFAYSRSIIAKSLSDRALFIFTAFDSFLLSGENEPIQQTIAERLACVVGENSSERRKIIKNVKDMYKLRSKFVHHNLRVDDAETFKTFLRTAHFFYMMVIRDHTKFKTKEDFIFSLDEKRFSY